MDTISIKLNCNLSTLTGIHFSSVAQNIKYELENLRSSFNHTFLTVNINAQGEILIKISYPRFFAGTNAYLITTKEECLQVQQYLKNFFTHHYYLKNTFSIKLLRVDIAFTYFMDNGQCFHHYENIYKIIGYVYQIKGYYSKTIKDTTTGNWETIIYSSQQNLQNFHSKVMIYNQYLNIQTKAHSPEYLNSITNTFPDLSKRIRIEVCKKIDRSDMTFVNFFNFDIFGYYAIEYKKYLLENLFNIEIIDSLYENWANDLAKQLFEAREAGGFNYENFILEHFANIYDYEVVRRAATKTIHSESTREKAITTIRKVLKNKELNGIIVMDCYKWIKKIRESIENSFNF